jgi:UDP-glucose 4-epimerase
MNNKKVVVTGGAGFIGSHLATELVNRGCEVIVIDNLYTGKLENIEHIKSDITFIKEDICNTKNLIKILDGVDVVFHQAAIPSVPRSHEDPHGTNRTNIRGMKSVLTAVHETGVPRVVYASSSSVYGDSPTLPKHENMPVSPLSRYALQKVTDEHYAKGFTQKHSVETVGLRYFNVFGPRQDPDSEYSAVIPLFIKKMLRGESPTIFGDGETSRDFTHVSNVVHANILASEAENISGEVFNVALGDRVSLNELVSSINKILGKNISVKYENFRPGDVLHSQADIEKAKKSFGFREVVNFEEGLRKTIESLRQN